MIGFNSLGRKGRLGNQMFQYAALRGLAAKISTSFCIPNFKDPIYTIGGDPIKSELFENFNLKVKILLMNENYVPILNEGHYHFNKELFDNCPDNIILEGYFQSEKYFKHIENYIKKDFSFKEEILKPCKKIISTTESPIALHVRRGDYLKFQDQHPLCSISYYQSALEHFDSKRNVIVFSDDYKWCSETSIFKDRRFILANSYPAVNELCLMTLCNDFIIANSSYSWWGAWLSSQPKKKVICPEPWFGKSPLKKNHDTKDLLPNNWIKLNVASSKLSEIKIPKF